MTWGVDAENNDEDQTHIDQLSSQLQTDEVKAYVVGAFVNQEDEKNWHKEARFIIVPKINSISIVDVPEETIGFIREGAI